MNNRKGFKPKATVFSGKKDCLRALGERVGHAKTDEEVYKILCIRIEILMLYGDNSEALRLLEDCLKYYIYVGDLKAVERLIKIKS